MMNKLTRFMFLTITALILLGAYPNVAESQAQIATFSMKPDPLLARHPLKKGVATTAGILKAFFLASESAMSCYLGKEGFFQEIYADRYAYCPYMPMTIKGDDSLKNERLADDIKNLANLRLLLIGNANTVMPSNIAVELTAIAEPEEDDDAVELEEEEDGNDKTYFNITIALEYISTSRLEANADEDEIRYHEQSLRRRSAALYRLFDPKEPLEIEFAGEKIGITTANFKTITLEIRNIISQPMGKREVDKEIVQDLVIEDLWEQGFKERILPLQDASQENDIEWLKHLKKTAIDIAAQEIQPIRVPLASP